MGRARPRVLHELLGRLLRHQPRLRHLSARALRTEAQAAAYRSGRARDDGSDRVGALPGVHSARPPRRHARRARERRDRLLRRPTQPGLRRRRTQPCRLHRRSRRGSGGHRPSIRPLRRDNRRRRPAGGARRPGDERRRGDRDDSRLGARPRCLVPRPLQPLEQRRQRHRRRAHALRLDLLALE